MNRINIKELAALALAVTLAFPAASSFADPQDTDTGMTAPVTNTSPTEGSIDSVDGTGLSSASENDSVDGTGLSSASGIDSVDGTGLRSVAETDLAASGERLLTVPASTRSDDCIEVDDAAALDSSECTPSADEPDLEE